MQNFCLVLSKFGLNALAKILNNNNLDEFKKYCDFLSCT